MSKYLLFAGQNYYASGGWSDFVGEFDTEEEARVAAEAPIDPRTSRYGQTEYDWAHIVLDGEMVSSYAAGGHWRFEGSPQWMSPPPDYELPERWRGRR